MPTSLPPLNPPAVKKARLKAPKRRANTAKNKCECGLSWCNTDLDRGKITISQNEKNADRQRAFGMTMTRLGVSPTTRSSATEKKTIRLARCALFLAQCLRIYMDGF